MMGAVEEACAQGLKKDARDDAQETSGQETNGDARKDSEAAQTGGIQ
jgi:hypothetical protein